MERRQVNFTVNKSTDEGLDKLAELTFRSKGQVIDWLVAEELAMRSVQSVLDVLNDDPAPDSNNE